MTLIQQLIKKGILDQEKASSLEYEIRTSGKRTEELVLEKGIVAEALLFGMKSEVLKIPLKEVMPDEVPLKVLELIPEDSAKYYKMIPLARKDSSLEVGMVYPEDLKSQEALKFLARQGKFTYRIFLIAPSTLDNLLRQYKTLRREVTKALEELETELKTEKVETRPVPGFEFEKMAAEAPITKVVAVILRHAVEGNASDIHVEPTREKLRVRFRLDGVLHSSIFLPLKIHLAVITRIKILANLKIDESRVPQDGRFSTKVDEKEVDFRVSTFPTTIGEKAVLRVLDPSMGLKSFEDLGLERRNYTIIKETIQKPFGLILVSGPTGCGKTTTLYAVLQSLNKEGVNIMTLEDPVEYFIEGVNQSQIKPEIGYTFATGLRHILRQDPNIIMVGEIRDEESAALAIHAALTGHIVLSTIHTNNAAGIIPRLIDLKVAPFLVPPSLSLGVAQRLLRRLCPHCKKKIEPPAKTKDLILREVELLPQIIKKEVKIPKNLVIYEAVGCKKCRDEGYAGRVALYEILTMTEPLAEIILKNPTESMIAQEAQRQGMVTMVQDGILKVLDGVTSIEEVIRVAQEK